MNARQLLTTGILLWIASAGVSLAASGDAPSPGGGTPVPQRTFFCPDLANTDIFRSKGLMYVHSVAYAEAVASVARGESPFAPGPVPPEWNAVASQWYLHLFAHEGEMADGLASPLRGGPFSADGEPCDPVLLHKASLEYRSRPGNGKAGVVFPYYVPMAAHELEERILAVAYREDRVAAKIALAERMGAEECSPGTLARAKEELESARRVAADGSYDALSADPTYGAAERLADELLDGRRIAGALGFVCHSGNAPGGRN